MVLDSLATTADLPSAWELHNKAETALAVASAAIRDAAGCAISQFEDVTVSVVADSSNLLRLPGPVTEVTAVEVDDHALASGAYRVLPEGLWRHSGWSVCGPVLVEVTYTGGLVEVPADVADLCVQLAVAWLQHHDAGGGSTAGLTSAKLDDAAETYTSEAAGRVSPVYIPEATCRWLSARFGGGATVVSSA